MNKKILVKCAAFALFTVPLVSCNIQPTNFDLYRSYHNTAKGLEIYCWEKNRSWYSGILLGTNRLKRPDEVSWLQNNLPCPLLTMKEIVAEYKEEKEGIYVVIVSTPPKLEELMHKPDESETYYWVEEQLGLKDYRPWESSD